MDTGSVVNYVNKLSIFEDASTKVVFGCIQRNSDGRNIIKFFKLDILASERSLGSLEYANNIRCLGAKA